MKQNQQKTTQQLTAHGRHTDHEGQAGKDHRHRPRTGRPSTKSCTAPLVTVDTGNIRSTNSGCTATRTFAAW